MGPLLIVGDVALPNPAYIALAKSLAFVRRLWWPSRALAMLVPLLTLAIAAALDHLAARGALRIGGPVLVAAMLGELVLGGLAPLPTWDATVPAAYRCLAEGPPGALIELPHGWSRAHIYYQTAHGRPIMGGMLENDRAFVPAESEALQRDNSWLVAVRAAADLRTAPVYPSPADKAALQALGYRYVILTEDAWLDRPDVHRERVRQADKRLRELLGAPVYVDARARIYAPWGGASPCVDAPVTPDTEPIGRTEVAAEWWGREELGLRR